MSQSGRIFSVIAGVAAILFAVQELVDRRNDMTQINWFFLALSIVLVVVLRRRQKGEPA